MRYPFHFGGPLTGRASAGPEQVRKRRERSNWSFVFPSMPSEHKEQAAVCRQKAAECERRAALVSEDQFRNTYVELAKTWLEMAKQVELLDHGSPER